MSRQPEDLPAYEPTGDVAADKAHWRMLVRAARRRVVDGWDAHRRTAAAQALRLAGLQLLRERAREQGRTGIRGMTVTAFEPMRTESPVDGLTRALLAEGVRVLVPVTLERPRLDWVDLTVGSGDGRGAGPMTPATGAPQPLPRLSEAVLAEVDVAFIPGLAVSCEGVRLGQGGGYYDSVLPRLRELTAGAGRCPAPVVAVLHDHEVVSAVPAEDHDAVVDAVLTPGFGVRELPLSGSGSAAG